MNAMLKLGTTLLVIARLLIVAYYSIYSLLTNCTKKLRRLIKQPVKFFTLWNTTTHTFLSSFIHSFIIYLVMQVTKIYVNKYADVDLYHAISQHISMDISCLNLSNAWLCINSCPVASVPILVRQTDDCRLGLKSIDTLMTSKSTNILILVMI